MSFDHLGAAIWHYLWSAVKDKCYADKPETIGASSPANNQNFNFSKILFLKSTKML